MKNIENNSVPVIMITDLIMEFCGKRVLDLPSLAFFPGSLYALAGHNGSGKTTLLRIAAGLETPTKGYCRLAHNSTRIGFCPQKPYMFQGTVQQNIAWGLGVGCSQTLKSLAQRLGLEPLLRQSARSLSAGEAQKVSLARMLLRNPQVLFLDEPTANLDESGRAAVELEITSLVKQGATCIMATHMADHAYRLNGTVIRLEQGRVTSGEIVNIFEGALEADGAGTLIRISDKIKVRTTLPAGNGLHRRYCLPATDVVLSCDLLDSSMQNSFRGTIISLRQNERSIEAIIDIGIPLRALVTSSSLERLSLTIGVSVVVSFKATAVRTV